MRSAPASKRSAALCMLVRARADMNNLLIVQFSTISEIHGQHLRGTWTLMTYNIAAFCGTKSR